MLWLTIELTIIVCFSILDLSAVYKNLALKGHIGIAIEVAEVFKIYGVGAFTPGVDYLLLSVASSNADLVSFMFITLKIRKDRKSENRYQA